MKKAKTPKVPSAAKTAQEQFKYGNISTFGPTGNMVYGTVGPNGQFQADPNATKYAAQIQETPFQKSLREAQESGTMGLVNSITGLGLPDRAQVENTDDIARNTFDRFMFNFAPQRAAEDNRTIQYLSDRGLPMAGRAAGNVLDDMSRRRTGENEQIMRTAQADAGNEQTRRFNLATTRRDNAVRELMSVISPNINPSRSNLQAPTSSGINMAALIGDQYRAQQANAQNAQSGNNALLGTLGSLGAAALSNPATALGPFAMMLSDRAMKTDIEPAGFFLEGLRELDINRWRYLPESGEDPTITHVGPMAQDFQRIFGVGDGRTIHLVDVVGVLLGAMKELAHVSDR